MKTSTRGLMAICSHEGIVLSRYRDSVGVWTIGVGHTAAAGNPNPKTFQGALTLPEAFGLLRHDILKYEADVERALKVPVEQHEFDALVSFHYNTGSIGRAKLVKALNEGRRASAAALFMSWSKPPEIIERRQAEQKLFAQGVYPKPVASIYPADAAGVVGWGKGKPVDLKPLLGAAADEPAPAPAAAASGRPTLKIGATGDDVRLLQRLLAGKGASLVGDGQFGKRTEAAVVVFQKGNDLTPDGVVGDRTWAKLES